MAYTKAVKFSSTGRYGCGPDDEDDVYTVEEFRDYCNRRMFIDYDGIGCPVREGKSDENIVIKPSRLEAIPDDATHVVWYNR